MADAPALGGWTRMDPMLLLAFQHAARRGGGLRDVIAAVDNWNRSIVTRDEVEGAARRLTAAGVFRIEGNTFIFTEPGAALVADLEHRRVFEAVDALAARLDALGPPPAEGGQALTPGLYDAALARYYPGA